MVVKPAPPALAHVALPPSGRGPGVLVVHPWWGLNDFFKGVCNRLARQGFVVLAPDLFNGRVATTAAGARRLRAQPRREPTYRTLTRAINRLIHHPGVKGRMIGVIGFSMGGHWALWLSQRPELPIGATVTFYGARAGDYRNSRADFLGHFAEQDDWVSEAARKKLRTSLDAAQRNADFYVYPGTSHWFFEADREDAYDPEAAELAWQRTVRFLRKRLRASIDSKDFDEPFRAGAERRGRGAAVRR